MLFVDGAGRPFIIDSQRGALLLDLSPSSHARFDAEEFTASFVTSDWSFFLGVTNTGRWLRRSLDDLEEITISCAQAVLIALDSGNDRPRLSEQRDVLMSQQSPYLRMLLLVKTIVR